MSNAKPCVNTGGCTTRLFCPGLGGKGFPLPHITEKLEPAVWEQAPTLGFLDELNLQYLGCKVA